MSNSQAGSSFNILPRATAYQEAVVRAISARSRHNQYYALPFDEKHYLRDLRYATNWKAVYSEPFTSLVVKPMLSADDYKPICQAIHLCPASRFDREGKPRVQRMMLENRYSPAYTAREQHCRINDQSSRALGRLRLLTPQSSSMPTRSAPPGTRHLPPMTTLYDEAKSKMLEFQEDPEVSEKQPDTEKEQRVKKWVLDGEW